jgi:hypothetical protein
MKVLLLPPEKTLKPLARLRLLAADMAVNGSDRPEIVAAILASATPEDAREGLAYWARHLARDVVAAARKPTGSSPRAGSNHGQTDFGWGVAPVSEALAAIDRYCHRYVAIIGKVDLGRRVAAIVRPYMADHDVAGLSLIEVGRLAGVSAEDLEALAL